MAQTKKPEIRQAVIDAATALFTEQGYVETQISAIARRAGISTSNVYKYFASKIDILYAIYDPWLRQRITELEADLPKGPKPERLRAFFRMLWDDIPIEDNGFANILIQALATARSEEEYRPELLYWFEGRIVEILRSCVDETVIGEDDLKHLAEITVMVFDGFLVASRIKYARRHAMGIVELMCQRLVPPAG
jgi:AcrR family transcriptional regulator